MDKNQTLFIEFFRKWHAEKWQGTRSELAEYLELSYSQIANILNGYRGCHETTRIKICKKIGVDYRTIINCDIVEPEKFDYSKTKKIIPINDHRKPEDLPHEEIITRFKNKEWARRMNAILLVIEEDPKKQEASEMFLKALADQITTKKKPDRENGEV